MMATAIPPVFYGATMADGEHIAGAEVGRCR